MMKHLVILFLVQINVIMGDTADIGHQKRLLLLNSRVLSSISMLEESDGDIVNQIQKLEKKLNIMNYMILGRSFLLLKFLQYV